MTRTDQENLEQRLEDDTGMIGWSELERHFARGVLLVLERDLDIVTVGAAIVRDQTGKVEQWQASGKLRRATMDDAERWHLRGERFRALVVAPWVLAQPVDSPEPA